MPPTRRGAAKAAPLLFCVVAAAILVSCAGAPSREAGKPASPGAPPPVAAPAPVPARPPGAPAPVVPSPPEIAATRFLRILLDQRAGSITLAAETLRAWDADGRIAAETSGSAAFGAIGDRVQLNGSKLLGGVVDVAGSPDLRMDGRSIEGRIRLSARNGQLQAVAVVPVETYVAAVISREVPLLFHQEALKAQAVATRTYAYGAVKNPRDPGFDVVGSVEDQVFDGTDGVAAVFREAAAETNGLVLLYRGELARTVFHSTCGGRTESAANAWGKDIPYLRSQACEDCSSSPVYRWQYRLTRDEARRVARAMGIPAGGDLRISVAELNSSGRISRIRLASSGVSRDAQASAFRKAVGYARMRSLWATIEPEGDGWVLRGRGYGHGVGMCQYGANGMAKAGKTYREILARYYPGTGLSREVP